MLAHAIVHDIDFDKPIRNERPLHWHSSDPTRVIFPEKLPSGVDVSARSRDPFDQQTWLHR